MQNCTEIYITDNSGKKFFKTLCSSDYVAPEYRNLERKLNEAKMYPDLYHFLDIESAQIEQVTKVIGQ